MLSPDVHYNLLHLHIQLQNFVLAPRGPGNLPHSRRLSRCLIFVDETQHSRVCELGEEDAG